MTDNTRPEIGNPVVFTAVLERVLIDDDPFRRSKRIIANWEEREVGETRGFYIGYRTVYDGEIVPARKTFYGEWDNYEEGYFIPTKSITHALVVRNERTNPVRVSFENLRII